MTDFPNRYYKGDLIREKGSLVQLLDSRPPSFYSQYSYKKSKQAKIYLVCRKKVNGSNCLFCVRKDQYFNKSKEYDSHTCKANLIQKYFQPDNKIETTPIDEAIKNFVGKNKLPLNIVTTSSFKEFSRSLISAGQNNPNEDPDKLIPNYSRQTFTKHFIKYSDNIFKQKLEVFKKIPGSCIAVDAGKHKTVPYLMIILSNARIKVKPLIVDCIRYFQGKKKDYSKDIEKLLKKLFNDKIKITAIISDNLRSQVSAINHRLKESMQQKTLNGDVSQIIWLSCACHSLSLGLKDAEENSDFGILVSNLLNTSHFLRSKNITNLMHKKCPLSCKVRWTGIFDTCFWILTNFTHIHECINKSLKQDVAYDFPDSIIDGLTKTASILYVLLLPFKYATNALEADNMPASYVIPIVNEALKLFDQYSKSIKISKEIINSIKDNVYARMFNSQSGHYWKFLYSLTPIGRKELRSHPGITSHGVEIELPKVFTLEPTEKHKKILDEIINNPDFYDNKSNEMFMNYSGNLVDYKTSKLLIIHDCETTLDETMFVNDEPSELNLTDDININQINDDAYSDYDNDYDFFDETSEESSTDESSDSPEKNETAAVDPLEETNENINEKYKNKIKSNGPLVENICILKEIATTKGYSPEECSQFTMNYIDWITEDPNCLIQFDETLKMGTKCWNYMEYLPHLKAFSHFVIPLMGIVASEAACERAFWKQRRILGDQCTNMRIEVEKAKLNYAINT